MPDQLVEKKMFKVEVHETRIRYISVEADTWEEAEKLVDESPHVYMPEPDAALDDWQFYACADTEPFTCVELV